MINKCGVALEGGGARGAYHMGAIKALYEREYIITDIVGTSIGSINAAIIAQGDFNVAYKIWEEITYSTLFNINDKKIKSVFDMDLDIELLKYLSIKVKDVIKNKGIDTSKMREILEKYIDEEKLRNSNINFGLVTYCLSDIKPVELYIKDIPEGKLIEYILASSRLPGFKQKSFDDKVYIDGGVYNNCPISMIKHCKNIFAIKTGSLFKMRDHNKILKSGVNINIIEPRKKLAHILDFDNTTSKNLLELGYYDTIRYLDNLDGINYYIKPKDEDYFFNLILKIKTDKIYKIFGISSTSKKQLFDIIIPQIIKKIYSKECKSYKEIIIVLLEYILNKKNINIYNIYNIEEIITICKDNNIKAKNKLDQVILEIIKNI